MSVESSADLCNELISALNSHLAENRTVDALTLINSIKYEECIKDKSWDIIPAISKYLVQDTLDNSPDTFHCCNSLLETIALKANPEEALLEFLEEAECVENDLKFLSMLKPLEIILFRLPKRRQQSLEWCLNTIQTHITSLPLPENYKLEGSERKLMDSDPSVIRITNVYEKIVCFYKPFINELSCNNVSSSNYPRLHKQRDMLICYIFQLLGRPLAVLDLHYDDKSCSSVMCSVEKLLNFLKDILSDPIIFLEYAELREFERRSNQRENKSVNNAQYENGEENIHIFTREEKLPTLSIAVFYYLILVEKMCHDWIPQVYSPIYIYQQCLFLIVILLECSEELIIYKGLFLAKELLSQLSDGSVSHSFLESSLNGEFVKSLSKVMIYSEIEEMRKSALLIFQSYLHKFDDKGQYLLMLNLPSVLNHSGVLGYLITQLKDMIVRTFNSTHSFFSGKYLFDLMNKYCSLEHGAQTDLVENADQIVSSLNLIRFLVIRDKGNKTGIWDYMPILQKSFLDSLREGINLSRAHYKLKLKDLEEENKISRTNNSNNKSEVTIVVGGQQLPNLPYENKAGIIHSALNLFDLTESLLSRINECVEARF